MREPSVPNLYILFCVFECRKWRWLSCSHVVALSNCEPYQWCKSAVFFVERYINAKYYFFIIIERKSGDSYMCAPHILLPTQLSLLPLFLDMECNNDVVTKGGDVMLCFCWLRSTILSERIQTDTTGKHHTGRTSSMVGERIAIPVLP